jgi:hypothetical protein
MTADFMLLCEAGDRPINMQFYLCMTSSKKMYGKVVVPMYRRTFKTERFTIVITRHKNGSGVVAAFPKGGDAFFIQLKKLSIWKWAETGLSTEVGSSRPLTPYQNRR